ncbi:aminotransferase class III-fold pyridoxal phosphate-dependent enzyme [Kordia sp. YSTF-M3]|uniref:Aminotransferase class III-fold pyridoxal phosphate-dependent enzyme n=1 Tax=Kordia aestuariivivens TaxID=2759037 RepID=A0ABR7Q6C2_9FLAO|nr:aminotransferase class III-fold pyridoxal phosphate-dependent enzyme [Kordia aestuariivivens]MBC8754048.1 aminotransferase class III-fold pyridoxal phosphate-dependent enzyme [Kordia aestuariivivens]
MKKLIQEQFEFGALEIKRLNGYENVNYLIDRSLSKNIFKTYKYSKELLSILEAENKALLHLQEENEDKFPKPIPFANGDFIKVLDINSESTICRMLSFLDGEFLGDTKATSELFKSFGVFLAQMNIRFQKFNSYVLKARQWEWDIQYLHLNKKYIADISNPHDRNIVNYFFQQFEENVTPILPALRKQIIHNDANEWNVLVKNGKISGIIDFGDLAYSLLINELSVAITYGCYDKKEPLEWAIIILKSYHEVLPLEEKEIKVLYYTIAARLCISVCNSANSRKTNPDNEYATSSEKPAWAMLHKWIEINPTHAENQFRKAIGLPSKQPKTTEEEINNRLKHISPILSLSYKQPIAMARAAFQYMYDTHGNTFLDAYNNIPHVGHSHPKVVAAGQKQMALLNTNTRYLYDLLPTYAEKLLSKFPKSLNKVYFVNSGSAASDLAMRMVDAHTKHEKIMVMEHGYHGNTQLSIDISDYKFSNEKGDGKKNHILKTPIPDTYRGTYKTNDGSAGQLYAKDAIKKIAQSELPIAAFISEPIVGCGGQIPLAKGYLKELYPVIRKQGGVCISDEVQTGFGRLGDHFWGFEAQEVVPDIVIIGKPMGNGHPMGAVITTDEISDSFSKGVEFFSSFGGNPVSCAIGLSVLEVIEEENLQENAKIVGDFYKSLFMDLQSNYDCIGDVRGSGLFIGVEIIKNEALDPDTKLAAHIKNELRNQHILISTDGPFDNVLKTKPPLCFTKENAQLVVEKMEEVLKTYYKK